MSSIDPTPKRTEANSATASSQISAQDAQQRRIDALGTPGARPTPYVDKATGPLHATGTLEGEAQPSGRALERPTVRGEHHLDGPDAHATLATHLEQATSVFLHKHAGMPELPLDEDAHARTLDTHRLQPDAARQRALQQGQHGFIVPLMLRRPKRAAYSETAGVDEEANWGVEAIEGLIATLHVSAEGHMQTHDDPAMRKERRVRRWLVLLAHRRRLTKRQNRSGSNG